MNIGDKVKIIKSHSHNGEYGIIVSRFLPSVYGDDNRAWNIKTDDGKETAHFEKNIKSGKITNWRDHLRK